MKFLVCLLALVLTAITNLFPTQIVNAQDSTKQPVTAFVNVNVVPMDRERVIEDQAVELAALLQLLIHPERDQAVGP